LLKAESTLTNDWDMLLFGSNSTEFGWRKKTFQLLRWLSKPTTFNNLMYLRLHPPKHGKLHPCEKFHFMNTCHLQWVNKIFIPKSKSYTAA
jgi:hypothetical protein